MADWLKGSLAAALLASGMPADAADCPAEVRARSPAEVAARIERYGGWPRGAQTYRALAGLGDPPIEPDAGDLYSYDIPAAEAGAIARILPGWGSGSWYHYANCRLGYAGRLGAARIAAFGAHHPYVEQWLRAQRAVFSACGPPEMVRAVALPPPLPTAGPALARLQAYDRGYQAASLMFYRGDPGAKEAFRLIAGSPSPHAHVARFMIAAIDARGLDDGTYLPQSRASRAERAARAATALARAREILADPRLADVHPLAQGLIGYLGYWTGTARARRAHVRAVLDALEAPRARLAASPAARDLYARALGDVDGLHRDFPDPAWWLTGSSPATATGSRAMAEAARRRPLAAWLIFPRSPFESRPWIQAEASSGAWPRLRRHAEARRPHERGRAWAIALAGLATRYDRDGWRRLDALERDIAACPNDDRLAAFAFLAYHQVRAAFMYPAADGRRDGPALALAHLGRWRWRDTWHFKRLVADSLRYLIAAGRIAEARRLRDRVGPLPDHYEVAVPLLLLAEDEDHFVAQLGHGAGGGETFVNRLPVAALARLAAREDVPAEVRARFARVAWARLYALERPIPATLDLLMRRLNPEIAAGWTSRPGAGPGSRSLLLDVLRSPGLNILITDHNRARGNEHLYSYATLTEIDVYQHSDNNWWCAWERERHAREAANGLFFAFFAMGDSYEVPPGGARTLALLAPLRRASWLWNAQDRSEQAALARIPCAPRLLAERAIAWRGPNLIARLRGHDGQDEALALAVRATRYGCQRQGGHGAYSRAAFALLHQRFAASGAARRTPYWFDCSHFFGGCAGARRPAAL